MRPSLSERTVRNAPDGVAPEYGRTSRGGRAVSSFRAERGGRKALLAAVVRSAVLALGLLGISLVGCGKTPGKPVEYPPPPPRVEESYEVDDANRPLTEKELDEASARLTSDPAVFVAELEKAPPVRQASLIYVLQRDAAAARENRALLKKLSASDRGIVRRAALFALETIGEEDRAAKE